MDETCTVYRTADIIGKKWTVLILLELYKGKRMRFSEIRKAFPEITPKMLSMRLKELEDEGMVKNAVNASSVPVVSTYTLTDSGRDFYKVIKHLKDWALRWKVENKECSGQMCKRCMI